MAILQLEQAGAMARWEQPVAMVQLEQAVAMAKWGQAVASVMH